MKPLRWPTNAEMAAYMRLRQSQNLERSRLNRNENWFADILRKSHGLKWNRQTIWGYRVFDFWSPTLGVAIEIDGSEHDPAYDAHRDEYNFRRSAVVVLRVRNRNEEDARRALGLLPRLGPWAERRAEIGINGHTKADRRKLLLLPRFPSLLTAYLVDAGKVVQYS